jgi:hypothetical protein
VAAQMSAYRWPTIFTNDWTFAESSIDALLVTRVAARAQTLQFAEQERVQIPTMRLHVIGNGRWR